MGTQKWRELLSTTGSVKIEVTKVCNCLFKQDADGDPIKFMGNMRIFKESIPSGLEADCYSIGIGNSHVRLSDRVMELEEAKAAMERHRKKTCSWLYNHTLLPLGVTRLDGEFLCPPPVFLFEEGDLCLDMTWNGGIPTSMCKTCIVARKRASGSTRKRKHGEG